MVLDFSTELGGVKFPGAVMNASGPNDTTIDELWGIACSESCAVTTKTTTILPRPGNSQPRYWEAEWGSINSSGLPNPGYLAMIETINQLKLRTPKPIIASFSGFNLDETVTLAKALNASKADILELNLSCPNIAGKPQVAYDCPTSEAYLTEVRKVTTKPLAVKLSPYTDGVMQDAMVDVLRRVKPEFIATINSIGNGMVIDADKKLIVIKPKWGGVGGSPIKPIAIGNIRRFYERLPDVPIIGIGGVMNGKDAFELILAGASTVGVGSAYAIHGPDVFGKIQKELGVELQKHGYSTVAEAVGQARPID